MTLGQQELNPWSTAVEDADDNNDISAGGSCTLLLLLEDTTGALAGTWVVPFWREEYIHSNSWKVIQSQNQYFLINQKLGWSVGELVVLNINAIYLLFELPYICICTSSCGITLGSSELPFWLSGSGSAGLSGKLNKKGTQHILIRNLNQSTKHLGYHTWG